MRGLSALFLILVACGPTLYVGYARPGYVVQVREKSGDVLSRINYDGVIDGMYGFCRDGSELYVTSHRTGTVLRFRDWRYREAVAEGLPGPTDVLVLADGDLLVACAGSTHDLLDKEIPGEGALLRVSADGVEPFLESELITIPTALLRDKGAIYIGQRKSTKVLKYDGELEVFAETHLEGGPMHLAFSPDGKLHAASAFDTRVVQLDPPRTVVHDEHVGQIGGIAFGKKGELYVTSHDRGEIRVYQDGRLVRILAEELAAPWSISRGE
ncbi:MAG: NHL repeat-containing protein [Planctomycetota bacterium]